MPTSLAPTLPELSPFFETHTDVDLVTVDLTDWLRSAGAELSEEARASLLAYQRVLRLCGGDRDAASRLIERGVTSAHDLNAEAVDAVAEAGDAKGLPAQVLAAAEDVCVRERLLESVLHGVRCPHYQGSRFGNAHPSLVEWAQDLGEGSLLAATSPGIDDRPSAFSPSAYLYALREFLTAQIPQTQTKLKEKRPDLFELSKLPKDRAHSETVLPYLELVNEVLVKSYGTGVLKLAPDDAELSDKVFKDLATARLFPFGLPFQRPLEVVRAYLGQLGVGLAELFEQLERPAAVVARERLRLSAEQAQLITDTAPAPKPTLNALWGLGLDPVPEEALKSVAVFEAHSSLRYADVVELLYQDLGGTDTSDALRELFYINAGQDPLDLDPKGEAFTNLTAAHLARIHRFLRLAGRVGWSLSELDWVLRALDNSSAVIRDIDAQTLKDLASVEWLRARLKLPVEQLCGLWADLRTTGLQRREAGAAHFDRVFNEPVFFVRDSAKPYHPKNGSNTNYPRNPLYEQAPETWDPANKASGSKDAKLRVRLLAALCLDDAQLTLLASELFHGSSITLSVPNLSRLHRYATLASLLGHTPGDLLRLLKRLGVSDITAPAQVVNLVQWSDGLASAGVSVSKLEYLCGAAAGPTIDLGYSPADVARLIRELPPRDTIKVVDVDDLGALGGAAARAHAALRAAGYLDASGFVSKPLAEITYEKLAPILALGPAQVRQLVFDKKCRVVIPLLEADHPKDALTVELWVYFDEAVGHQYLFHRGGHHEVSGHGLMLWNNGHTLAVKFGQALEHLLASPPPGEKRWLHVAYTWDRRSNIARLYVNGAQQSELRPKYGVLPSGRSEMTLSVYDPKHETSFQGRLCDLRLWSRSRSASELTADMHRRLRGDEAGLVGCWRVDDGGPVIKNAVSGGVDGVVAADAGHTATWTEDGPPPLHPGVVAAVDILTDARASLDAAEPAVTAALATQLSASQALISPALHLAALRCKIDDPLRALIDPATPPESEALAGLVAKLAHALILAKTLRLSPAALTALPRVPAAFGIQTPIDDTFNFTAAQVLTLHRFALMESTWATRAPGLIAVLDAKSAAEAKTQLATVTGWPVGELEKAMESLQPRITDLREVSTLYRVHRVYLLSQRLGVDVAALSGLAALNGAAKDSWGAYQAGAATAVEAANAKVQMQDWAEVQAPIEDRLNELIRDAIGEPYAHHLGFSERLEDLYEHLLIDVEMSGCARIDRLKQALNSFQLYAHRVLAGLEPGATITDRAKWDAQWPNMRQYRLWEAEQRLYAYPESFIDPGLRALASDAYEDVKRDLLSGDLSDASAQAAFRRYLEAFNTVANLEPVSAAYAKITTPELPTPTPTLFIVGRTRTPTPDYFVRRATIGRVGAVDPKLQITRWWPWERLPFGPSIQASSVSAAWAFGRLHLVWVSQREEVHSRNGGGTSYRTKGVFASVHVASQDATGSWSLPRKVAADLLIHVTTEEGKGRDGRPTADARKFMHSLLPGFPKDGSSADWMLDAKPADIQWSEAYPWVVKAGGREELVLIYGESYELRFRLPATALAADGALRRVSVTLIAGESPYDKWLRVEVGVGTARSVTSMSHSDASCALLDNYYPTDSTEHTLGAVFGGVGGRARAKPVHGLMSCTLIDTGDDEAFIAFPRPTPLHGGTWDITVDKLDLRPVTECTWTAAGTLEIKDTRKSTDSDYDRYGLDRVSTATVAPMLEKLAGAGVHGLLHLDTQDVLERPFGRLGPTARAAPIRGEPLDFFGPFSAYLWEIFIWLPFLVAKALHDRQRFEEAQAWYAQLYDPYAPGVEARGRPTWDCPLDKHEETPTNRGTASSQELHYASWAIADVGAVKQRPVLKITKDQTRWTIWEGFQGATAGFTISCWLQFDQAIKILHVWNDDLVVKYAAASRTLTICSDHGPGGPWTTALADIDFKGGRHLAIVYDQEAQRLTVYVDRQPWPLAETHVSIQLLALGSLFIQCTGDDVLVADLHVFPRPLAAHELGEIDNPADRPWGAMPLRDQTRQSVQQRLNDPCNLSHLAQHPKSPDVIAQVHICALQKSIALRTIDNMVDWGDQLFGEDAWESNVRATMLYVQAGDILGRRPKVTSSTVGARGGAQGSVLGSATQAASVEQFVLPTGEALWLTQGSLDAPRDEYPVPSNPEILGYWDLIDDRLYKLRHCMNIEGEGRTLALYQAPIAPGQRAAPPTGPGTGAPVGARGGARPRSFDQLIEHAKQTTYRATRLGQALLRALESKDSADVDMMALKHEQELLAWSTSLKETEIVEQSATLEALRRARDRVLAQGAYDKALLRGGDFMAIDGACIALSTHGVVLRGFKIAAQGASIPGSLLPTIFGTANGNPKPGEAAKTVADAFGDAADMVDGVAGILSASADLLRRKVEQAANVTFNAIELAQADQEIAAAEARLEYLKADHELHLNTIAQVTARDAMIQAQFTGPALYQWMIQRASAAYYRAFNVAYDLAQMAQRVYQEDCRVSTSYIGSAYWDASQRGLLAAEGLLADLERLHLAYIQQEPPTGSTQRATLSLSPQRVDALRLGGSCSFEIDERDLARLHPGQIQRRVVSVAVQLEGPLGTPEAVQASLELLDSCQLMSPCVDGARLLLCEAGASQDLASVRWDHLGRGRVAASACEALEGPRGEAGRLELRFSEGARSPFAGAGAISRWTLRIPKASNRHLRLSSLTGVRIDLRYQAQDGGPEFTRAVVATEALRTHHDWRGVSLRSQAPHHWRQLLEEGETTLVMGEEELCCHLTHDTVELGLPSGPVAEARRELLVSPRFAGSAPRGAGEGLGLTLGGAAARSVEGLLALTVPGPARVAGGPRRWSMTLRRAPDFDVDALEDLLLFIPFEGELDWSGLLD